MNHSRSFDGVKISVILPCWRDGKILVSLLEKLMGAPGVQWIPVLAEPDPATVSALARLPIDVIICPAPSRGSQMNRGAECAGGEILLFHHADSLLTREHLQALGTLARSDAVGGAFYRKFDQRHPFLLGAEPIERWHCRKWGTLYGDQSIFVRSDIFRALGGFAEIPLMEDVEFSRRLRRSGPILMLDPPIRSSPRKHLEEGSWRTTLRNLSMLISFQLGASPKTLHRWYYRGRLFGGDLPRPCDPGGKRRSPGTS
jgi:hypothetical protein